MSIRGMTGRILWSGELSCVTFLFAVKIIHSCFTFHSALDVIDSSVCKTSPGMVASSDSACCRSHEHE